MIRFQKITPNLWFDSNAEDAVRFYTSIFKDSSIVKMSYYGREGQEIHGMPEGTVMVIEFSLDGQSFLALNGGPVFKFNEAISMVIHCGPQEEVDYFWEKLAEGGDPSAQQCGWLKDKFGLSWQVVPQILGELIADEDADKSARVMHAMLQMKKIDIAALEAAYFGTPVI
ncbi:MAG TPA: VOC family protein [Flavobacterium sp.]|jgi:predicted 3-demethylubiquinone-9 3-methyltransferase (glyoxalase superfamily)